jgi:hypothetical protein
VVSASLYSLQQKARLRGQKSMAKRMTITIETTSLLIIRARIVRRAWCPECGAVGEMVTSAVTAVSSDPSQHAVDKWIDSMNLHRPQAPDGGTLICLNSLLAQVQKTKTT